MTNTFHRSVARALIVCTLGMGMPLPSSAGIVSTEQAAVSETREQVRSFLDRADVQARMQALGVDANAARDRVNALTDDEAAALAERIDQLPAGGTDVLGFVLVVFLILLLTDILGLTKIFPFTRSVH